MNKMIFANLVHRPLRSIISVFAIAVEVTLIMVIVGLATGILNDNKARQRGVGADVMVRPPGSSMMTSFSGNPLSIKVGPVIAKLPHAAAVAPVMINTTNSLENVYGIDLESYEALGPFHFISGGPFAGPYDIIIDDVAASADHRKVGSTTEVLNQTFRVCGIVEHGKGGRKFIPISTMQSLVGGEGRASIFYVRLDDPKNYPAFKEALLAQGGMEKYVVISMEEWLSLVTPERLPGFSIFIDVVIGVAVGIGFIVIFQSMYTAVMERTREIGILKSMGASKLYIVNVVLRETTLLAVAGIAVGLIISILLKVGLTHRFPSLQIQLTTMWRLRASGIAIVGALLGALYPAFKAAQKDPIDALAYE